MFAKFSPDGLRAAYVDKNDIYAEDIASGRIVRLTWDGSDTLINGTFDWVYEEEFGLRDGFRWSPDGRYIAFWQFDTSWVKEFNLINNTDSLYPEAHPDHISQSREKRTLPAAWASSAPAGGPVALDPHPRRSAQHLHRPDGLGRTTRPRSFSSISTACRTRTTSCSATSDSGEARTDLHRPRRRLGGGHGRSRAGSRRPRGLPG